MSITTYAPLHFAPGRAQDAALPILGTVLGETLDGRSLAYSDGVLTITINADTWAMFSGGERILFGVLEQIAGHHSTVTPCEIANRLDDDCKRAVLDAYAVLFGLEAA